MPDNTQKALDLIKKAAALLEASADAGVKMPASDDVDDLEKGDVAAIAEAFSISVEGKKASEVKALVKLAAEVVEGKDADDLDDDLVTELCEAVGVQPKKKLAATVEALKSYFDSVQDTEDGDTAAESEDADSDTEAGDDDDDKPAKGKSKAKKEDDDDDNGDDAKSDDSDADSDSDTEASSDDEAEEVSDKEKKKRVDAFNKIAKNKVKDYAALTKLLVDNDGETAEWGVPYVKGEGEEAEAYCCGLKLKTLPHPDAKKAKKGEEVGQCKITGKVFEQTDKGQLVEIESDND